jgi:radical SAM/Cys-rich protein
MDRETVQQVIEFIKKSKVSTIDLTGGAPELNPHFRDLVEQARALGCRVIDRCNLTVLNEPGQQDTAAFLAAHEVEISASLPCYLEENVDAQRGKGVFGSSIQALQTLNALGYGQAGSGLLLNLVYNPQGPSLPPPQCSLEQDYHKLLKENYDIDFNSLLTITNMPIKRFGSTLVSKGQFNEYMDLLKNNSSPDNLASVMCRSLISIDWQGYVYDCDFNQMLDLPMAASGKARTHIADVDYDRLQGQGIAVADHCYACIAGQGSSCAGALSE